MAERYALIYTRRKLLNFLDSVLHRFESYGMHIRNPRSGNILRINNEGEQVTTNLTSLRQFVQERNHVSFQWWLAPEHDIFCHLRKTGETSVLELGMEGCNLIELNRMRVALLDFFEKERLSGTAIGLVFDPEGVAEDFEWDLIFIGDRAIEFGTDLIDVPELIALPKEHLRKFSSLPTNTSVAKHDGFVLLSATTDCESPER